MGKWAEAARTTAARWGGSHAAEAALLGLGLAGGAALRLHRLGDESMWFDEVISVSALRLPSLEAFLAEVRRLNLPTTPLYFAVEYCWARLWGGGEYALRLLSVAFGCVSAGTLYALARACFGRWAGGLALICYALSPRLIYYDQEIRMYAQLTACATVSMLALWRAAETDGARWYAVHMAANACVLFTHLLGAFLFVPQGLWLLAWRRRPAARIAAWLIAHVPVIAGGWWYVRMLGAGNMTEAMRWVADPAWRQFASLLEASTHWIPGVRPIPFAASIGLAVLAISVRAWAPRASECAGHGPAQRQAMALSLAALWWLVPAVMLGLFSLWVAPAMIGRYVLYAAPGLLLLLAGAVSRIPSKAWRIAASLLVIAGFALESARLPRPLRSDVRSPSRYVLERGGAGDGLIVHGALTSRAALGYLTPDWRQRAHAIASPGQAAPAAAGMLAPHCDRVWALFASGVLEKDIVWMRAHAKALGLQLEVARVGHHRLPVLLYRRDGGAAPPQAVQP